MTCYNPVEMKFYYLQDEVFEPLEIEVSNYKEEKRGKRIIMSEIIVDIAVTNERVVSLSSFIISSFSLFSLSLDY